MYRTIKYNFGREPYIDLVNDEPLKTLKTENRHDSILVAIDDVLQFSFDKMLLKKCHLP